MGLFDSAFNSLFGGMMPQQAQTTSPFGTGDVKATLDEARTQNNLGLNQQASLAANMNPYAMQGLSNQANVYAQQQALAGALQAQSMGQGPNPAQAQLAQNTAANTANQAALMAGQRGSNANAGLMARQIGMQGGANQQAMAGQAATLQAQQQLAAQQALMQQQSQMAGLASQQVGQYGNAVNAQAQNALGGYQASLGAIGAQNQTAQQSQANINNANAGFIGDLFKGVSGAMNGGGGAAAKAAVPTQTVAFGGTIQDPHHQAFASIYHPSMMFNGGTAPEIDGKVPGKAAVAGDHPKNDTVPAMLSPGEIVIPKSILEGKDPIADSAAFVASELSKQHGPEHEDFHAALAKAISSRKKK
jgi:hypothetical protein